MFCINYLDEKIKMLHESIACNMLYLLNIMNSLKHNLLLYYIYIITLLSCVFDCNRLLQ